MCSRFTVEFLEKTHEHFNTHTNSHTHFGGAFPVSSRGGMERGDVMSGLVEASVNIPLEEGGGGRERERERER